MCGIVAILGRDDVSGRLVEGLRRLEYRGYDSAGIAVATGAGIAIQRAEGKLAALEGELAKTKLSGVTGIGHTRWATHGAPSERNAHPHRAGPVTVVHNGIIENHDALRRALRAEEVSLLSDTDTEIAAHLCARALDAGMAPEAAVRDTLDRLEGSYALAFLFDRGDDLLIVARNGSPLAIGYGPIEENGEREMFAGSDALALAPFTRQVSYLEDGDMAVLTRRDVTITDRNGQVTARPIARLTLTDAAADRGEFRHFMAKEIHEQPESLARVMHQFIAPEGDRLRDFLPMVDFTAADRVVLIACGTSHYACHVAKYWFDSFAGLPVEIEIASEYRYRKAALSGREIAIFVSQSGETADTLAAMRHLAGRVAARIAIVNVATSSMAREADAFLDILSGPEIGVASTKAFTGQLATLAALAMLASKQRGQFDADEEGARIAELAALPRLAGEVLALEPKIRNFAACLAKADGALFIGRGATYPIALEGALKLKEISYMRAEGYAAGELKHGPIALVDETMPVIVLTPSGPGLEKTLSNAEEVAARGGRLVLIGDGADVELRGARSIRRIRTPALPEDWAPLGLAIAVQMIAYHVAVARGCDVDQPRNLAKSVTVE